jgi:hypothetical protein
MILPWNILNNNLINNLFPKKFNSVNIRLTDFIISIKNNYSASFEDTMTETFE